MSHRIYVRWPGQRTSDKTTKDSQAVADFAYRELQQRQDLVGALGITWTHEDRQVAYHPLSEEPPPRVSHAKR